MKVCSVAHLRRGASKPGASILTLSKAINKGLSIETYMYAVIASVQEYLGVYKN